MSYDRSWVSAALLVLTSTLFLVVAFGAPAASAQDRAQCTPDAASASGDRAVGDDVSPSSDTADADACGSSPRGADPSPDGLSAQWDLADGEPIVLVGYEDAVDLDVELPAGWHAVENVRFRAAVEASEIARSDLALRFDIDDRPASTWIVGDPRTHELELVKSLLDDGGFQLGATTTSPLVNDDACPDPTHVGRWVDLGLPVLETTIAPDELDIARTIAGLTRISDLTGQPVGMHVHAAGLSAPALETVGALAAALGRHGEPAGWQVLRLDPAAADHPVDRDHVGGLAGLVRVVPIDEHEPAVTLEIIDHRPVITLTGDEHGLRDLAVALADPDRLLYFHDIDTPGAVVPAPDAAVAREVFVLEELGYDDRTLRGQGRQSLVYRVHVPAGAPQTGATFALYATHAPELVARDSTVSIRLNDSEDEVVALPTEDGRIEVLHEFVADLRPGLNYVTITTDLGQPSDLPCQRGTSPWITVSKQSGLAVDANALVDTVEVAVGEARFSLAAEVDFVATDIVLPDGHDDADLALAVQVIGEMARRGEAGAPRLVTDADADTANHLVFLGPRAERPLLSDALPDDAAAVELRSRLGLASAAPSPFTPGRIVLAYVGGDDVGSALAADAALGARVNGITEAATLVGLDDVRPIGAPARDRTPETLAFDDREAGPSDRDYEEWLLAQAARIDEARAPEVELRRMMAFGLLLMSAATFGLAWIRRMRQRNAAGVGGSGGH